MKFLYKKILIIFICLFLINSCSKKNNVSNKIKKQYNLSIVVGPQFYWGQAGKKFADLVKKRTNGKVNIKVFYGGQLFKGSQTSEFQLLSTGAIDFAFGSTINWSSVIQELNLFSLPFFINSYDELDRIENGNTGEKLFSLIKQKNVMPLAWAENGFRQLTNSKRKISDIKDLKNLKIRVVGSPIFIDIFRYLGADPVSMNWGDAVSGFAQGVVDGQENPVGILMPVKIWEYHKYLLMWDYVIDPVIIAVNKNVFDGFDAQTKQIIIQTAKEVAHWEKALVRAGLDKKSINILKKEFNETNVIDNLQFLKDKKMQINYLNNKQKKEFKKKLKPVYDKWIKIITKDIYHLALKDKSAE